MKPLEFCKQHTYINYCEAIIFPDGTIEYATPSHQQKLISISGKSMDELMSIMPIWAAPNEWLVEYLNCIAVWYDYYIYSNINTKQKHTLDMLKKHNIISLYSKCYETHEYTKCEELKKLHSNISE